MSNHGYHLTALTSKARCFCPRRHRLLASLFCACPPRSWAMPSLPPLDCYLSILTAIQLTVRGIDLIREYLTFGLRIMLILSFIRIKTGTNERGVSRKNDLIQTDRISCLK
jgi:hypothetical protein